MPSGIFDFPTSRDYNKITKVHYWPWYASTYIARQCHPSLRSGSGSIGTEMLRCAQHDNGWVVTLSPFAALRVNSAKGQSRSAQRCFAALSMTKWALSMTGAVPSYDREIRYSCRHRTRKQQRNVYKQALTLF